MIEHPPNLVATFGKSGPEGRNLTTAALGQRGAALCSLSKLNLPAPPGLILTIDACKAIAQGDRTAITVIEEQLHLGLQKIAMETGCKLGDPKNLLLLSIRPSPPVQMSGALEAVLNLGLNDETVEGLGKSAQDAAFAHQSYRRFLQNYAHVVMGDDPAAFDDLIQLFMDERGYVSAQQIKGSDGPDLTQRFKAQFQSNNDVPFPQDVHEQLWGGINALLRQWNGPRARAQRKLHNMKDDAGLALVIQAMVFGNQTEGSGAGHAASRNPATGERLVDGGFLMNAQGPDLSASLQRSLPLAGAGQTLRSELPEAFAALATALDVLERELKDAVEVDFTVAQGALWLLDLRIAKRSAAAAMKIVTDLVGQNSLAIDDALLRIDPFSLDQLLHSTLDPKAKRDVIAQGLGASPGAASGMIIFDAAEARKLASQGHSVILVRTETAPEDIKGLHLASGVLTTRGGMTSHAAVIARGMGKPCVSGALSLKIDITEGLLKTPTTSLRQGDVITIDGSSGQVLKGESAVIGPTLSGDFATVLGWADKTRRMAVRANAETIHDAKLARDFGAEGIGLARSEHMFFEGDRIIAIREMILADTEKERQFALAKLLPILRGDCEELFSIMAPKPVTIRLLDPPLHEFLPSDPQQIEALARTMGAEPSSFRKRVSELREQNPMLGHRGVRLLLSYPEITDMQARAIFEAAATTQIKTKKETIAEIMVPLVASKNELTTVRQRIEAIAKSVSSETGQKIDFRIGTMIELPRAALKAQDIAEAADFFSFGTNDLTQTTFGISRDDSARFLAEYTNRQIFPRDPFVSLDTDGVGELIHLAVERGRKGRTDIQLGICGEHGGDPDSIASFEAMGLDYISCSPFRLPIARLAAAQATLRLQRKLS